MIDNPERFAWLVTELSRLLKAYLEQSSDSADNPISHYALMNLMMSLQVLEKYAMKDPATIELMKSLYEKHKIIMDQQPKH